MMLSVLEVGKAAERVAEMTGTLRLSGLTESLNLELIHVHFNSSGFKFLYQFELPIP
jgi:hypothetical protein